MRSRGCGSNKDFFGGNIWIYPVFYRIFAILLRRKKARSGNGEQGWGSPKVLKNFFKKTLKKIWIEKEKGITFAPANGEGPG